LRLLMTVAMRRPSPPSRLVRRTFEIAATGLADLMKAAGLTHGGFACATRREMARQIGVGR